jgi:hypothetical protein
MHPEPKEQQLSRAMNLNMTLAEATAKCRSEDVGISAIEPLASGGVRLVCMSSDGADTIRSKLKSKVIAGDVVRERHRPARPLW